MNDRAQRRALGRAFRDITVNLLGVFRLYGADPALTAGVADALATVFRAHLARTATPPRAPNALQSLLDELRSIEERP